MAHLFYHSISTSSIAQKLILFARSPTSLGRYDADASLLKRDSEDEQERCTRIDACRNNFWADHHESPIDLVQWHGVHWASAGQTRWTHQDLWSGYNVKQKMGRTLTQFYKGTQSCHETNWFWDITQRIWQRAKAEEDMSMVGVNGAFIEEDPPSHRKFDL